MFDIIKMVQQLQQLKYAKTHGLHYKRKPKDTEVQHTDGTPFDIKAEQESEYMSRQFNNYSLGFGRRLSKAKGQRHYPGGGFAGHTIRGG